MLHIDKNRITKEVNAVFEGLIRYTETARVDSFLSHYADCPDFHAVSGDGAIRNYEDFSRICKEYYGSLKEQKLTTQSKIVNILDETAVALCWSGNIDAFFKNGDMMKMPNYTVTFLFKKMSGEWKVIHSHESALPPEIIKSRE
jgi:hypothetical protein